MKKAFLLLAAAVGFSVLQAQLNEGTIVYERKINMHRSIRDEQMRAMVPEFRSSRHLLMFSDSVSLFRLIPEDEAPDPFAGGGGPRMQMRMGGPSDGGDLYKNFTQAKSVQSAELGGKYFLVTDTIQQQPWKLGSETKQILGYTCLKATRKITIQAPPVLRMSFGGAPAPRDTSTPKPREIEIVAWYAENIASPVGPEDFGQLPGIILQLDRDNGATVYTATEIRKTVEAKELKEPKKGKVVSNAEFNKMRMDLMNRQVPGNFRAGG